MVITDVRIKLLDLDNRLKAIASVTFDSEIVIHDIKIIEGENGLFLAMPSRQVKDGKYRDIAHPISSEARNKIEKAVFDEYKLTKENQDLSSATDNDDSIDNSEE